MRTQAVTPATLRIRRRTVVILVPAGCATKPNLTRAPPQIRRPIESHSATRNMARGNDSTVPTATTTRRDWRSAGRSVRRGHSNIFRAAEIHARPVITADAHLVVIWILRIAIAVMQVRVSVLGREPLLDV